MGHVVIVGPMGVGKTTVGRRLASHLQRPLHDSDSDLLAATGLTGREIVDRDGIESLHAHERAVLLNRLADPAPAVIAAAGSVVDDDSCRDALSGATVVWLDAPPAVLIERQGSDGHRRPVDTAELEKLDRHRRVQYEAVADVRLDATQPMPAVADAAAAAVT